MGSPEDRQGRVGGNAGDVKPPLMSPAAFGVSVDSIQILYACRFATSQSQKQKQTQTEQRHRYVGGPNQRSQHIVYGSWRLLPPPHERPHRWHGTGDMPVKLNEEESGIHKGHFGSFLLHCEVILRLVY